MKVYFEKPSEKYSKSKAAMKNYLKDVEVISIEVKSPDNGSGVIVYTAKYYKLGQKVIQDFNTTLENKEYKIESI